MNVWHNFQQGLIALDCLANVIVCTVTGNEGYGTETLSAHAWRAREKPLGKVLRPVIDRFFSWQKPDPEYRDAQGNAITSHCQRAFEKEMARAYLPVEYRISTGGRKPRKAS